MLLSGRHTWLRWSAIAGLAVGAGLQALAGSQAPATAPLPRAEGDVVVDQAACTAERLGTAVPVDRIGEPVRRVTLAAPTWVAETATSAAYCRVDGVMDPVDTSPTTRPINFAVALPARWIGRSAQLGGGGMNGTIPNLTGGSGPGGPSYLARGLVTYGSDSGHQAGFGPPGGGRGLPGGRGGDGRLGGDGGRGGQGQAGGQGRGGAAGPPGGPGRGGAAPGAGNDWALNDEAIANLGHMQLKKTHDAAMVLIERLYGARPRFNYYIGSSQGGREALTVAQRYPADYDGISANVPIVSFSTLMLAPALIRIQEQPLANWVTAAKVNAIRGEFMRQCDELDGLADGIINHYMACRAIFDVSQGEPGWRPWAAKRCPDNVDPDPEDTSASACLTDGQIATLEFTYSRYAFATPLAHGTRTFGMWVPNTDPSGSGLIVPARFRGQEGAAADAPMHTHLGSLGVTGFLMRDLAANPLDYVEGGPLDARRLELSRILDSTNPDLSAFRARGGRMIVTIGTNDTLASPGAQLDYYQAVLETMGRDTVDEFARLFVMPQAGHGLSGSSYSVDGNGRTIEPTPIPNRFDQTTLLFDWVERQVAPPMSVELTAGDRSLPLCSYPAYPRYVDGPTGHAGSYRCTP